MSNPDSVEGGHSARRAGLVLASILAAAGCGVSGAAGAGSVVDGAAGGASSGGPGSSAAMNGGGGSDASDGGGSGALDDAGGSAEAGTADVPGSGGGETPESAADVDVGTDASTDSAADGSDARDGGGAFRVPFDWNGILGNGQSLSVGARGTPVVTTSQPFHNMKLADATGQYPLDAGGALSLVPLVEPIRPFCPRGSSPYPCNIYGETPHSALSIELTTLARAAGAADYVTLHSIVGQGAQPLSVIDKQGTGNAYAAGLSEARSFKRLAIAAGKTFGYVAVVFTHGEADNGNAGPYESGLYQLYQDYNADLRAITGQTEPIVLVGSQQASSPPAGNGLTNTPLAGTALSVWRAGVDHPGAIVCTGPKYQYKYYATNATGGTDAHVYAAGYRRLGEKYAEVIDAIVNRGVAWGPLQPTSATLSGSAVTVHFSVPNPPLAWEPSLAVSTTVGAWQNGRGFEVVDSTGPATISAAQIAGDSVVLTLSNAPAGTKPRVRYVTYNGCTGNCGDHLVGQLRDSDPFLGADVETLPCAVTQGSADVTCLPAIGRAAPLAAREVHDIVTGGSLADDTVVVATDKSTKATLSHPWTGASGTADLRFAYDERNYAVQFDIPVQ